MVKMTHDKIVELEWEIMSLLSYSPDLSPTDFYLFLNLDNHMRNKEFNNEADLKEEVSSVFSVIKQKIFIKTIFIIIKPLGGSYKM